MIASLTGRLKQRQAEVVILEVGGVGFRVSVSSQTARRLPTPGQPLTLLTHTAVREDDISLYGFLEEEERALFLRLITVSGIGPRLAMVILSGIPPRDLVLALSREDLVRLTAIPGVGKKTAERMIVDLKDKLIGLLGSLGPTVRAADGKIYEEALSALVNLGYPRPSAEKTLARVPQKVGGSVESVLREALKILSVER